MSKPLTLSPTDAYAFEEVEIRRRIDACPKLASLQSINKQLALIVKSEMSYNGQIAELIRRDPSLTARLLRMVNSVYFGLTAKVTNIEEAVLYLGLRQIRELSVATPVIEELEKLSATPELPWRDLWKHSIGTAIMTREILLTTDLMVDDDTDYVAGLLHNVGKVVMAMAFPEQFTQILAEQHATTEECCERERELIGWDHAQIGGHYLHRHQIADEITEAVLFHNTPGQATRSHLYAAAVQVADHLVRYAGLSCGVERTEPVAYNSWQQLAGWRVLYNDPDRDYQITNSGLLHCLQRLPSVVENLV